ncbi:MAG: inosine/xanthosine triphosphatase [Patescibacteria group bacterium]|jgi:inosine/xanthosine triphosphatase
MTIVNVGSRNQTKVQAVSEALQESKLFDAVEVVPVDVVAEEFGHPVGIEQVIKGAMDRAQKAFKNCELSFGIEGGLVEVPQTKSYYMEFAVCAIYDGTQFHLGMSPGFEWPKSVTDMIVHEKLDGSQALKKAGLTVEEKIGATEGGIWILTHGRMNRKEYNRLAVEMALIHLENMEHYSSRS